MSQTYKGRIWYEYYSGSITGRCNANLYYNRYVCIGDKYDVYGNYRNLAAFAGKVSFLLTIPAGIAGGVAKAICAGLGIASSALDFIIPSKFVSATRTDMT